MGKSHDHRSEKCAQCERCPGFLNPHSYMNKVEIAAVKQRVWNSKPSSDQQRKAEEARLMDPCKCGCARATHSRPNDECSRCPCIRFRKGVYAGELVTDEMDRAHEKQTRNEFALSLDMKKVTTQRIAKAYAQCQICKTMIKGPVKDGKKTKEPGEEWVGPPRKTDKHGKLKTPSMRHRGHMRCADEVLEEIKAENESATAKA